jgi:hypothetical protein
MKILAVENKCRVFHAFFVLSSFHFHVYKAENLAKNKERSVGKDTIKRKVGITWIYIICWNR